MSTQLLNELLTRYIDDNCSLQLKQDKIDYINERLNELKGKDSLEIMYYFIQKLNIELQNTKTEKESLINNLNSINEYYDKINQKEFSEELLSYKKELLKFLLEEIKDLNAKIISNDKFQKSIKNKMLDIRELKVDPYKHVLTLKERYESDYATQSERLTKQQLFITEIKMLFNI